MHFNRLWQLWPRKEERLGHIQWNVSTHLPCTCHDILNRYSRLDYAGPEILRGERYNGKEQDVWAFGVVAYVLLVGECPFMTADEAQDGLESPFASSSIALDERCTEGKERDGEEPDGGGALEDAAALVRACLQVQVSARPTFEKICQSRFLSGREGW